MPKTFFRGARLLDGINEARDDMVIVVDEGRIDSNAGAERDLDHVSDFVRGLAPRRVASPSALAVEAAHEVLVHAQLLGFVAPRDSLFHVLDLSSKGSYFGVQPSILLVCSLGYELALLSVQPLVQPQ